MGRRLGFVSLYTGAGGLDLGFIRKGMTPVFANDIDERSALTYHAARALYGDADTHEYLVEDLSGRLGMLKRLGADFIIGGPPCQGFSRAGRMDPNDPRSAHVMNFMEAVVTARPRAFVMENVGALASSPRWSGLLSAARAVAEDARFETRLVVLRASDHGVPQERERMFLLGRRRSKGGIDPAYAVGSRTPVTVRQGLAGVRTPNDRLSSPSTARIVPAKRPVIRVSPFAGMLFNGAGRPVDLERPSRTIAASLGGNHTPIIDDDWLADPQLGDKSIRKYHAGIVAGRAPIVPPAWRRLSPREAAALQGFPIDYPWQGPSNAVFRQIGNAVPPPLSEEIAGRMLAWVGADR
jgi:DNA (cytosine-5)-methyltransferase 1